MNEMSENEVNTVYGVSPGTAVVLAMLENGVYNACIISVYDPDSSIPGDVNMDGVVDGQDALRIMQYDAGWLMLINEKFADVNEDSTVDVQDALVILEMGEEAPAAE